MQRPLLSTKEYLYSLLLKLSLLGAVFHISSCGCDKNITKPTKKFITTTPIPSPYVSPLESSYPPHAEGTLENASPASASATADTADASDPTSRKGANTQRPTTASKLIPTGSTSPSTATENTSKFSYTEKASQTTPTGSASKVIPTTPHKISPVSSTEATPPEGASQPTPIGTTDSTPTASSPSTSTGSGSETAFPGETTASTDNELELRLGWAEPIPDVVTKNENTIGLVRATTTTFPLKLRISRKATSDTIDPSLLSLKQTTNMVGEVSMSTSLADAGITELTGTQLGNIDGDITIYIHSNSLSPSISSFQLYYEGGACGDPIHLRINAKEALEATLNKALPEEIRDNARPRLQTSPNDAKAYAEKTLLTAQKVATTVALAEAQGASNTAFTKLAQEAWVSAAQARLANVRYKYSLVAKKKYKSALDYNELRTHADEALEEAKKVAAIANQAGYKPEITQATQVAFTLAAEARALIFHNMDMKEGGDKVTKLDAKKAIADIDAQIEPKFKSSDLTKAYNTIHATAVALECYRAAAAKEAAYSQKLLGEAYSQALKAVDATNEAMEIAKKAGIERLMSQQSWLIKLLRETYGSSIKLCIDFPKQRFLLDFQRANFEQGSNNLKKIFKEAGLS